MNSYENPTLSETCDLYEQIDKLTAERDALLRDNAELVAHLKFAVKLLHGLPGISGTAQVDAMRDAIAKHGGAK